MENKPPSPPISGPETPTAVPAPDSGDVLTNLRSTHAVAGSSSDTENSGPPSAPGLDASPAQRSLSQLGDYQLLKKIGSGAMGAVYKSRQLSNNRKVALKVLFKHVAENPKLVERFHREARVSEALDHPNIVRGFEAGEDHGWHYFAMEFVDGDSLQKWLTRVGKLSLGDALHIVLSCARALQHAHAMDLVHRDIKPDNILITGQGEVKVADLGMVKQLDEDMSLTQTGHAVGTPWYMPLEQAKNAKDTDGRCDIYALGCVFYACLTGRPPFTGRTLVDVIQAKEAGTFPTARSFSQEVPERVDMILVKMTAKLPKYRYQNCTELIKDLQGLGLANRSLTFLEPSRPEGAQSGLGSPSTRTPFPEKTAAPADDLWFVRYKKHNGNQVVQQLTTQQVLKLLETPNFDAGAKASRTASEGFRTLATFKEFEKAALGRVSRSGADKQTFRSRKLYEKIVEEQSLRDKPEAQPVTTLQHWFGIFWRVGVVALILGMLYLGATLLISSLKVLFG